MNLPDDVWEIVLPFDFKSVLKIRTLSKGFNNMTDDFEETWKREIMKKDPQFLPVPSLSWFQNYKEVNKKLKINETKLEKKFFRRACKRLEPPPPTKRKKLNHTFHKVGGFEAHPDDEENVSIKMKSLIYLKEATKVLLELESQLEEVDEMDVFLKNGMMRYKMFMDLKSKYPDHYLVPTIDIECIWMSHLTRPTLYQKDCKKLYNRVIDHHLTSLYDHLLIEEALAVTSKLWKENYNQEYGGKFVTSKQKLLFVGCSDVSTFSDKALTTDYPFSISLNEVKDREWYSYYQNFMDMYSEESRSFDHLEYQIKSYERFMYMNAVYPDLNGHPSYAIDLIWHAHMAHPLDYIDDTEKVVGFLVDHCPWADVFDDDCQEEYKRRWEEEFSGNSLEKDHMLKFD